MTKAWDARLLAVLISVSRTGAYTLLLILHLTLCTCCGLRSYTGCRSFVDLRQAYVDVNETGQGLQICKDSSQSPATTA